MDGRSDYEVVEMDTVKGKPGSGKVLITMLLRRNSVLSLNNAVRRFPLLITWYVAPGYHSLFTVADILTFLD